MQRLEVSSVVRLIYRSLGVKGLTESLARCEAETAVNPYDFTYMIACLALIFAKHYLCT